MKDEATTGDAAFEGGATDTSWAENDERVLPLHSSPDRRLLFSQPPLPPLSLKLTVCMLPEYRHSATGIFSVDGRGVVGGRVALSAHVENDTAHRPPHALVQQLTSTDERF